MTRTNSTCVCVIVNCVFRAEIEAEAQRTACKVYAASVPDQQKVRALAPRGKSMEELGISTVSKPKVLSKSSDHLYQMEEAHILCDREKRDTRQHCAPLIGSEENVQRGPEHRVFKEPGLLEHTSTAVNSWVRTSSVSGKEGKVTATAGSPRGTSENRYHFNSLFYFINH